MRISLVAFMLALCVASAFADDEEDVDDSNPSTADGSWPGPSADERFCGEKYVLVAKPSAAQTERCAKFFSSRDPQAGVWRWKMTRPQLAAVEKRIAACGTCGDAKDDAVAVLAEAEKAHLQLDDYGLSIEPTLEKLLTGKPITKRDIVRYSALQLWRFRNAPYARHGRPFKSPELEVFFYGDRTKLPGAATSKLLPLKRDPAFKESMLDKIDKQNVATVVAMIKHKKLE